MLVLGSVGSGVTVDVGDAGVCCWLVFACFVFESLFRNESEVTEARLELFPLLLLLSVMLFSFDLKKLGDEDRLELGEGGTTLL